MAEAGPPATPISLEPPAARAPADRLWPPAAAAAAASDKALASSKPAASGRVMGPSLLRCLGLGDRRRLVTVAKQIFEGLLIHQQFGLAVPVRAARQGIF